MSVLSLIGGIDLDPNGAHSVGVEGTLSGLESIEFGRFLNTLQKLAGKKNVTSMRVLAISEKGSALHFCSTVLRP
jgi:hypothetical protein